VANAHDWLCAQTSLCLREQVYAPVQSEAVTRSYADHRGREGVRGWQVNVSVLQSDVRGKWGGGGQRLAQQDCRNEAIKAALCHRASAI
jgi:hypothetical protein